MKELKPIFLTEGLFTPKNNYDEIKYSYVVEIFKKVSGLFKLKLSKSSVGKDIKVYTHGYPKIYVISKRDYRGYPVYSVTAPFKISDITMKTGYGETIIINELLDICQDINSDNGMVKAGLYYADSGHEKLQIRVYLDNKCLPDLLSKKNNCKSLSRNEVMDQINENLAKIVTVINKDEKIKQLGSLMMTSTVENNLYIIENGRVLARQISITAIPISAFANFGLDIYSAGMNVKYYLDELFLNRTDLSVYMLNIQDKCYLFVGNNNRTVIR